MFKWFGLWSYRRRLLSAVAKRGWVVIPVEGPESWSYSVGLMPTLGSPEIVVSGVPEDLADRLMAEAFRQIQNGELALADRATWRVDNCKMTWREIDPYWIGHGRLHFALWHRRKTTGQNSDVRAFQLVFRDVETGLYPWEAGFPEKWRDQQVNFYGPAPS